MKIDNYTLVDSTSWRLFTPDNAQHGNYIVIRGLEHSPRLMPNAAEWFDIVEYWIQTIIYATVYDPRGES